MLTQKIFPFCTCSKLLPTDGDIEKEKKYLQRRLQELQNIEDIKNQDSKRAERNRKPRNLSWQTFRHLV